MFRKCIFCITLGNIFSPDFIKLLENDSRNRFFYCTCIFSALFYKCMCGKVVTNEERITQVLCQTYYCTFVKIP